MCSTIRHLHLIVPVIMCNLNWSTNQGNCHLIVLKCSYNSLLININIQESKPIFFFVCVTYLKIGVQHCLYSVQTLTLIFSVVCGPMIAFSWWENALLLLGTCMLGKRAVRQLKARKEQMTRENFFFWLVTSLGQRKKTVRCWTLGFWALMLNHGATDTVQWAGSWVVSSVIQVLLLHPQGL